MENRGSQVSSQVSTHSQNSQKQTQKPKQNSQSKPKFNTGRTSGKGESRNEKRARWAKKSKPAVKPVVKRGPVKEYTSACCSALATKPAAGAKESFKDPESGKTKDKAKGLGKWRCTTCHKVTKVTPRKPEPKVVDSVRENALKGQVMDTEVPIA